MWQTSKDIQTKATKFSEKGHGKLQTTMNGLQEDFTAIGMQVHCSTRRRALNKSSLHGRVMRKKQFICPQHKIKRLKFAKEHIDKPVVDR